MDETMSPMRSITTASVMVALGAVPSTPDSPVAVELLLIQANPMEITTDTPAYCLHLLDRVSDLVRLAHTLVPHEVTDLATEGQRMCATGQIRGGIMRLRSALIIMANGNGTAHR